MDDNTMGMIQDLIASAQDNAINASRFETLVNMLLDGASLNYNGTSLQVGNDSAIMAFVEAVRYSDYADALKALQKKKEEEDALKALQKKKKEEEDALMKQSDILIIPEGEYALKALQKKEEEKKKEKGEN